MLRYRKRVQSLEPTDRELLEKAGEALVQFFPLTCRHCGRPILS